MKETASAAVNERSYCAQGLQLQIRVTVAKLEPTGAASVKIMPLDSSCC